MRKYQDDLSKIDRNGKVHKLPVQFILKTFSPTNLRAEYPEFAARVNEEVTGNRTSAASLDPFESHSCAWCACLCVPVRRRPRTLGSAHGASSSCEMGEVAMRDPDWPCRPHTHSFLVLVSP